MLGIHSRLSFFWSKWVTSAEVTFGWPTITCPEINIVMLLQVHKVQKVAESPQVPRSLKWSKRDKMEFLRQLMRWGLPLVSSITDLTLNVGRCIVSMKINFVFVLITMLGPLYTRAWVESLNLSFSRVWCLDLTSFHPKLKLLRGWPIF